jgi:heme oxygenase
MIAEETPTIMLELKTSTQALHDATEDGSFNAQLVKGALPKDRFIDSLEQLFLVHGALERQLKANHVKIPAIGKVVRDYQYQEPYLRQDLEFFGRNIANIKPLPATARFIQKIEDIAATRPVALLGLQYVLEGSNNGSKFIAKAVSRAYQLADGKGLSYLDPYGDKQRERWQAFKDDMNAVSFTQDERAAIVDAACKMFEGMIALHKDLDAGPDMQPEKPAMKCPFNHGKTGAH